MKHRTNTNMSKEDITGDWSTDFTIPHHRIGQIPPMLFYPIPLKELRTTTRIPKKLSDLELVSLCPAGQEINWIQTEIDSIIPRLTFFDRY